MEPCLTFILKQNCSIQARVNAVYATPVRRCSRWQPMERSLTTGFFFFPTGGLQSDSAALSTFMRVVLTEWHLAICWLTIRGDGAIMECNHVDGKSNKKRFYLEVTFSRATSRIWGTRRELSSPAPTILSVFVWNFTGLGKVGVHLDGTLRKLSLPKCLHTETVANMSRQLSRIQK